MSFSTSVEPNLMSGCTTFRFLIGRRMTIFLNVITIKNEIIVNAVSYGDAHFHSSHSAVPKSRLET
jgi:hypothetical protein